MYELSMAAYHLPSEYFTLEPSKPIATDLAVILHAIQQLDLRVNSRLDKIETQLLRQDAAISNLTQALHHIQHKYSKDL